MVDLGQEADLGWCHGIVFRQEELETEYSTFVGGLGWTVDLAVLEGGKLEGRGDTYGDIEVSEVVVVRNCVDTWDPGWG